MIRGVTALLLAVFVFSTSPAEARHRHHHKHYRVTHVVDANGNSERIVAHPAGCPHRQFCGCGVSVRVFGHPIRSLYLAANYRHFPSALPAAGMVAWRYHHVFYIERVYGDGTVLAYDPNSGGHATRLHRVSLSGYHVVDPHRSRYAAMEARAF